VRVTRNATGSVKRLAAAVVVNHRVTTAANGKTTSTPLSSDEIEKLTALVQESIGFSKERGDLGQADQRPVPRRDPAQGRRPAAVEAGLVPRRTAQRSDARPRSRSWPC
jgi:flagellar M-ring protein FliF